jgi:hypothetical protein
MNDDNIPRGADHYWESRVDPVDHRDDPPEDDHEITDERAEQWAREMGEDERPLEDVLAELAEIYGVPV